MFWQRRRAAKDFAEEMRAHLELEANELEAEGMTKKEAERMARVGFGNVAIAQERFNLSRRVIWLDNLVQDIRFGLRAMGKSPGFTLASVLTLALGMGANTAIFSLINAVLLRSLPVQNPSELYFLKYAGAKGIGIAPPYPCFERISAQAKSFTGVAAFAGGGSDLKIRLNGNMERAYGSRVSGDYYSVLGLRPAAGRLLTPEDGQLSPAVAVISFNYWQQRFGGNAGVVGTTFLLDQTRFTIVGVMPRGFNGLLPGKESDVVLPITTMQLTSHEGAAMLVDTGSPWFEIVARLKPGVQTEQARAEVDTIFQAYMKDYPQTPEARRDQFHNLVLISASHGLDDLRKQFSKPLFALMTVVGLVLLIACANITNLLLARAANREREFAVRVTLGAGRGRLFRQLIAETAVLFAAGMTVGAFLAWYAVKAMTGFFAGSAQPLRLDAHWDWHVLSFTAGISLLTTVIFGAAPILQAMRTDPHTALKDGSGATASRGRLDLGRALVVFQVSLSLILLVGASLFLRTLRNLHAVDSGFHAEHVMVTTIQLLESTYGEEPARVAMWDRVLERVRNLPGVESIGLSEMTPLDTSGRHVGFSVPGFQPRKGEDTFLNMNTVSEDYFNTLGTVLIRGRCFTKADNLQASHVAVLNRSAVRQFFSGRDPIGTVVHVNDSTYQIVGVVVDVKEADIRQDSGPFIYLPMRQPYDRNFRMTLSVRTAVNPQSLILAIEKQVRASGPDTLITHTGTLVGQLDDSLVQERLISSLATAFGMLALMLSAVGLYGVLAYSVVRRTRQIGIRMALGELPRQVLQSILGETVWLLAMGLVVGIPASMLLARAVTNLLYGVAPTDVLAQTVASGLLAGVGLIASFIPAYRASRINPLVALRYE
jgi:predicted permease